MRYENFENNLELFVRGYNKLTTDGSEFHLTPEEFYIYCLLVTKQNRDESMLASVDIIEYHMLIEFSSREQTNKNKIREALKGLIEKRVLICVDGIEPNYIKNNTVMTLIVNDEELSSDPNEYKGFRKVYYNDFICFHTADELYIHHVISRFGEFGCSEARWARILSAGRKKPISNETARSRVREVASRDKLKEQEIVPKKSTGVITIQSGGYIDKNRQEVNTYTATQYTENKIKELEKENKKKVQRLNKVDDAVENVF